MPELPEVETVRRELERALIGQRVTNVRVLRRDVVRPRTPARLPSARLLKSCPITTLERRGKQLALVTDSGRAVVVHLGMSGQLRIVEPDDRDAAPAHTHVEWRFERGQRLRFIDPRRFGGLWTVDSREQLQREHFDRLGPDALTVTDAQLRAILERTDRALKVLLLDQSRLAGVGNIYADEALFRARLHPLTPARQAVPHGARLADAIRRILRGAIRDGGSTLRDYRRPDGQTGGAQRTHKVYGRAGERCVDCGEPLDSGLVAQRTTVWCPVCQPNR